MTEGREYEALSIRAGDNFLKANPDERAVGIDDGLRTRLYEIIESEILPSAKYPIVVVSDSYHLKGELASRYGFKTSNLLPQHGGFSDDAFSIVLDLEILKNSRHNHHVNLWKWWWSGFSHYTSLLFGVSSTNYVSPLFLREEVPVIDSEARSASPADGIGGIVRRFLSRA